MGATTTLLTVEQARELGALRPDVRYELHQGELIEMPPPKHKHRVIQEKLRQLLSVKAASFGYAFVECGFRGTPEYNSRVADVALLSKEHQQQAAEQSR
jgi:Uma2 family endonuclease